MTGGGADALSADDREWLPLFTTLVRLEIELWNAVDRRLRAESGVMLSRLTIMQVIAAREDCRVQDIAADLSITVGGVSKLVDRIEAAGHCRRVAHPTDRRSSRLELTPAGAGLLARADAAVEQELEARLAAALPPDERRALAATLDRLRAALRRADLDERTA
jgi:DNA-binding MarR family transcriptional regulator